MKKTIKNSRGDYQLIKVREKNINRWELDKSKMGGSSAVLFTILLNHPELFDELYHIEIK